MYSLRLTCPLSVYESVSFDLWEAGTLAISESAEGEAITLLAGFETNDRRAELLQHFSSYSPKWHSEDEVDWVKQTQAAWPGRLVGDRFFLAPPWCLEPTPSGRLRLVHNPGLACGTGEHPCTQLALEALERSVKPRSRVVDIGSGSGILAIAALHLGAGIAVGLDLDEAALVTAKENFQLNNMTAMLVAGPTTCLIGGFADITIANINGTVLLSLLDDLKRIARKGGTLILTGFPDAEADVFFKEIPGSEVFACGEWRCLTATIS